MKVDLLIPQVVCFMLKSWRMNKAYNNAVYLLKVAKLHLPVVSAMWARCSFTVRGSVARMYISDCHSYSDLRTCVESLQVVDDAKLRVTLVGYGRPWCA